MKALSQIGFRHILQRKFRFPVSNVTDFAQSCPDKMVQIADNVQTQIACRVIGPLSILPFFRKNTEGFLL